MPTIGQQIKAERQRRNLTGDELGRIVGRDRQSVYLWEADRALPSTQALVALIANGFVAAPERSSTTDDEEAA